MEGEEFAADYGGELQDHEYASGQRAREMQYHADTVGPLGEVVHISRGYVDGEELIIIEVLEPREGECKHGSSKYHPYGEV